MLAQDHPNFQKEIDHFACTIYEINTIAKKILDRIAFPEEIILKPLIQNELNQILIQPYWAKIEIQKHSDQSIHPFYFGKFSLPLPNFPVYGDYEKKFAFIRMQQIGHSIEMGDIRGIIFSKRIFEIENKLLKITDKYGVI